MAELPTNRFGVECVTVAEEEGVEPSSASAGPPAGGEGQPIATAGKACCWCLCRGCLCCLVGFLSDGVSGLVEFCFGNDQELVELFPGNAQELVAAGRYYLALEVR